MYVLVVIGKAIRFSTSYSSIYCLKNPYKLMGTRTIIYYLWTNNKRQYPHSWNGYELGVLQKKIRFRLSKLY